MKVKVLPVLSWLAAEMVPPDFSTISFTRRSPSPEPVSSSVPLVRICSSILKSFERVSLSIPMPVSETEI